MDIKARRKKAEAIFLETVKLMEPSYNYAKIKKKFMTMTDDEFTIYMQNMRDNKEVFNIETPNMKVTLNFDNILKAADHLGVKLFQRLRVKDPITGLTYLTNQTYFLCELPVRRMLHTVYEKCSVARSDKKVDALTGQVTGEDRSSSITYPEMQALKAQGFKAVLEEFVVGRGGNISAYAKLKQSLKEVGEGFLEDSIDPNSVSQSVKTLSAYLLGMGYDSNLLDRT